MSPRNESEEPTWSEVFCEFASLIFFLASGALVLANEFNWAILLVAWAIYLEVYDHGR